MDDVREILTMPPKDARAAIQKMADDLASARATIARLERELQYPSFKIHYDEEVKRHEQLKENVKRLYNRIANLRERGDIWEAECEEARATVARLEARAKAAEEVCQVVEMDMNCFVGPTVVEALIAWRAQAEKGGK